MMRKSSKYYNTMSCVFCLWCVIYDILYISYVDLLPGGATVHELGMVNHQQITNVQHVSKCGTIEPIE